MLKPLKPNVILMLLASLVSVIGSGCSSSWIDRFNSSRGKPTASPDLNSATSASGKEDSVSAAPTPSSNNPVPQNVQAFGQPDPHLPDSYTSAIARASNAVIISQSAQSADDWRLAVSRWQQAIALMVAVPRSSTHYSEVQPKLTEYRRRMAYAQQQANRSTVSANPDGVVVIRPKSAVQAGSSPLVAARPTAASAPDENPAQPAPQDSKSATSGQVFSAPIVRRAGSTPVVQVTFNGNQSFDMILDTGASGTLITQQMADMLHVVPVGETSVDTASAQGVSLPLGYVQSIGVGGAVVNNVLVAVAGPELSVGLLGHDFFGHYDVTIRENDVEFRER